MKRNGASSLKEMIRLFVVGKSKKKSEVSKALAAISYSASKIDTKDKNYQYIKDIINNVNVVSDKLGISEEVRRHDEILARNEAMLIYAVINCSYRNSNPYSVCPGRKQNYINEICQRCDRYTKNISKS